MKRDKYKCQFPNCTCEDRKQLQVHHIRKWSNFSILRFRVSNGITLCRRHHRRVNMMEEQYQPIFQRIANQNASDN